MKKAFLYTLFVIAATTAVTAAGRGTYVKNEVLIRFTAGTDQALAATALSAAGANVVERLGDIGWQRIRLPSGMSVDEALRKFKGLRGVDAVQPNFYYDLTATPNDPQYPNSSMYGLTKISAPAAWDLSTGSASVVVANIDTGVKYTHEDLAANMWTNPGEVNGNGIDDDGNGFIDDYYGYDFYFNDGDPLDEDGHGTHTSGTIGAVGNNGVGVVGVNWNVKIMAIKIYDAAGISSTSAMLINAYNYVRMMKGRGVNIRVTNNSYGGCPEACGYDQATKDALDAMGDAGILNVFAAGNDARNSDINPAYPASYTSPSIISVANSTSADEKNAGSNFGIVTVDLAAPGTGILSTIRTAANYGTSSGTSMAAPHVTGAAALLAAYDPSLSAASIKATILENVDQLANWNGVVKTGGRLNVANALQHPVVCSFDLSSNSVTANTKGGMFSVQMTAPAACDYSVKSGVNWIHIDGSDVRNGISTVNFRVSYNTTVTRSASVTIAGQTVNVSQIRP